VNVKHILVLLGQDRMLEMLCLYIFLLLLRLYLDGIFNSSQDISIQVKMRHLFMHNEQIVSSEHNMCYILTIIIFLTVISSTQLPRESSRFKNVDSEFVTLMKKVNLDIVVYTLNRLWYCNMMNPCLYVMNKCLYVMNTCLYVMNTCLYVMNTCLYVMNTCLYVMNTCLYVMNTGFSTATNAASDCPA